MDENRDNICTVVFLSFSTSLSFVQSICSRVDHVGLIILSTDLFRMIGFLEFIC